MKPCNGVAIAPTPLPTAPKAHLKAAELAAAAEAASATPVKASYCPPSKRKQVAAVQKPPTEDELNSDLVFPTLKPSAPVTGGATWGQLRERLAPTTSFKGVIEERVKREEEARMRIVEVVTDPTKMKTAELVAEGWAVLPVTPSRRMPWITTRDDPSEEDIIHPPPLPRITQLPGRIETPIATQDIESDEEPEEQE
jgi:hypothetical protein